MKLLIVGSLRGQLSAATRIAMDRGAKVFHAADGEAALACLRSAGADIVMIDVALDVGRIILAIQAERIHVPIVACGVDNDAAAAVRAIRAGAKEYIPLPPDPALIAAVLEAVAEETEALVYRDPPMARIVRFADQIARSEASILITGESGTGKEVLARYVHRKSARSAAPLISVNCAAIPDQLLESELFGHERGAFTGAVARRIGRFEEASGGTLLLDEISEMDVRLQAKLLRAIQERVIDRVGGSKPVPVDIRIIATSNRNLTEEVRLGRFREDLLYRLNVVNLHIPPLRDRPGDVAALAEHFVRRYSELNGIPLRPLSEDAVRRLLTARWPGNVRELENTLHRAVLLASGPAIDPEFIIAPDGLQFAARNGASAAELIEATTLSLVGRSVADVERDLILDTLDHCIGNRTHAANILGISIRTLRNKLNQYSGEGVPVPAPGERRTAAVA